MSTTPPSPIGPSASLKITFNYLGVDRTLTKHPSIQQRLKQGTITEADAALQPWYLRFATGGRTRVFKLTGLGEAEAIRSAKDILRGRADRPSDFAAYLASLDAAKSLTIGQLAAEWIAAGLPFSQTRARSAAAAGNIRATLDRALAWWSTKHVTAITPRTHADFVVWRRQNLGNTSHDTTPGAGRGTRSADMELSALSCLCQWAVKLDKIKTNPFVPRETFLDRATIKHCHLSMPDNDDQLHRILRQLFTPEDPAYDLDRALAGAWFAFSALTGLRPGEHAKLLRLPAATAFPPDLRTAPYGLVYPMPDGTRRMKVFRLKHGQNPAVLIHPALDDFLKHYLAWLSTTIHARSKQLFPGINRQINRHMANACRAAGTVADPIRHMKPHGFGRGYYVRVRRSQGIDDAAIAAELGQKTDGALIRDVYGDPLDPVGGNLHDWLPTPIERSPGKPETIPAWHILTTGTAAQNVISIVS